MSYFEQLSEIVEPAYNNQFPKTAGSVPDIDRNGEPAAFTP